MLRLESRILSKGIKINWEHENFPHEILIWDPGLVTWSSGKGGVILAGTSAGTPRLGSLVNQTDPHYLTKNDFINLVFKNFYSNYIIIS